MKRRLVRIDWVDSRRGPEGWVLLDELEPIKPCRCTTVGYLIADKPSYKTVAGTVSNGQVLGLITIPTVAIKRFRRLG